MNTNLITLEASDLEIAPLFEEYQQHEAQRDRYGMELGRLLLKWHGIYKAQGSRDGGGFRALLERVTIPRSVAYRWMKRVNPDYFVSGGTKSKRRHNPHAQKAALSSALESLAKVKRSLDGCGSVAGILHEFTMEERMHYIEVIHSIRKHLVVIEHGLIKQGKHPSLPIALRTDGQCESSQSIQ
jgi:hypothetical protein